MELLNSLKRHGPREVPKWNLSLESTLFVSWIYIISTFLTEGVGLYRV